MTRRDSGNAGGAGLLALTIGLAALAIPPRPLTERPTWEHLLAPYSTGAPLLRDFRIHEIRRGAENGVVVTVRGADDDATVEVLIVERGRWKSVHASRSFTIDYELPHSPAPERDTVTQLLADTIKSHDDGLPSPDAIALRRGDPSVLPWLLELGRGVRGILVGASFVLFALIGLHGSPALSRAGIALGVTSLAVRLNGAPSLRPDLGGVWMLPAAALLCAVALRGQGSRPRSSVVPLLAVTTIALALRLALGPWGPLHVNGHGPRFVASAAGNPADIAAYGPGYAEIFGPVTALLPSSPDWAIFGCNALFSALVPPLALAIGRMTGVAPGAALAAAMLLAIDPVAIRMGATEAYLVSITFLCMGATAALLCALHALAAQQRWRATALLIAAGLLLSQAARIHPSAWVLVATVPVVVVAAAAGDAPLRRRGWFAATAVSAGMLLVTSAGVLLDVLGNIRTGTVFRPEPPSLWPLVWIALGGGVYAVCSQQRRLALPAGIAVAAMLLTRDTFGASWIWQQSYLRLYFPLPLIAALACIPPTLPGLRWVAAIAASGLVPAWIQFGLPIATARAADQLEYTWVRAQLQRLPAECRVVHVASAGKRHLSLPTYVGGSRAAVAMDLRRQTTVDAALAPAACLVYVRTSLCSTPDGRPDCDAIERRLTLVPIAQTSFTVPREIETFARDRDTVEVVIARVGPTPHSSP